LPPARNSAYAPRMDAVPALGQHSAAILAELGLSPQGIEQLQARGVI
ncbi:CoA transferase, partial [Pseudomonas protegens]